MRPVLLGATKVEAIRRTLQQFGDTTPGIRLAVLSSADGFEVAAFLSAGSTTAAARVAAMSSSITALGDALTRETELGAARTLIIETDGGTMVLLGLRQLQPSLALAIVAGKQAILGHLLWAARNTVQAIERIVVT